MRLRQRTTDSVTHTPFVNTTEKPTSGQTRVRKDVWKNGWTPPALRGKRLPMYVDSGMEAMTTADAGEVLSSWLSRNHTDGLLSTKSVALHQSIVFWLLNCVDARLIDNLHQWMEKCARQKPAAVRQMISEF